MAVILKALAIDLLRSKIGKRKSDFSRPLHYSNARPRRPLVVLVVRATICATIDPPRRHPSPPISHVGFGLILAE
jgi:hypothetical protein